MDSKPKKIATKVVKANNQVRLYRRFVSRSISKATASDAIAPPVQNWMNSSRFPSMPAILPRMKKPATRAGAQIQESINLISDGQQLLEKSLLNWPNDNEPWRESLEPDSD